MSDREPELSVDTTSPFVPNPEATRYPFQMLNPNYKGPGETAHAAPAHGSKRKWVVFSFKHGIELMRWSTRPSRSLTGYACIAFGPVRMLIEPRKGHEREYGV